MRPTYRPVAACAIGRQRVVAIFILSLGLCYNYNMIRPILICVVAWGLSLGACGNDAAEPSTDAQPADASLPANYASVSNLLGVKCAPCHTTLKLGGVNHSSTYADTQGDSSLCPGKKVYECMLQLIESGAMPLIGDACTGDPEQDGANDRCLTANQQALVREWVAAGAPEL